MPSMHRRGVPQQQEALDLGCSSSSSTTTTRGDSRGGRRAGCADCLSVLSLLNVLRDEYRVGSRDLSLVGNGSHFLHARHGATGVELCKVVVRRMVLKWAGDSKMADYLTLQTLFRESNFDRYASSTAPLAFTRAEMARQSEREAAQSDSTLMDRLSLKRKLNPQQFAVDLRITMSTDDATRLTLALDDYEKEQDR